MTGSNQEVRATTYTTYGELADLFTKARATLAGGHWCQGASAVDKRGMLVPSRSLSADRFCLTGVLDRHNKRRGEGSRCMDVLTILLGMVPVTRWNDQPGRTWQEVDNLLARAIWVCRDPQIAGRPYSFSDGPSLVRAIDEAQRSHSA